jgi:cell division protein ZapE
MNGPISRYRKLIADGVLNTDPLQQIVMEKLQILWLRLGEQTYKRDAPKPRGFFGFGAKAAKKEPPLQGLYIWGGVGRGKTMAMDFFFEAATTFPKRRVHFHEFMQEVHSRLREERAKETADPLPEVGKQIAASARLLCFDEVQVTDMADAMILGRLFEGMLSRGVTIVATSNRPPDDLYKNGINRDVFVPFIDMIKTRLDILHLDSDTDHRLLRMDRGGVYITPDTPDVDNFAGVMGRMFRSLVGGAEPGPRDLEVGGRVLKLEQANETAMRAKFDALCRTALGPADYLKIAETFDTVMIEDVPVMGPDSRDSAKRFVTLIDALYDAKVRVLISAEAEPDSLYQSGDNSFEFERTASRLTEMRSRQYLAESKAELMY